MHVMICSNSACIFTAQNKHCNRIASGLLLFLPLWLYKTDTLLEFGQWEGLLYLQKEFFKSLKNQLFCFRENAENSSAAVHYILVSMLISFSNFGKVGYTYFLAVANFSTPTVKRPRLGLPRQMVNVPLEGNRSESWFSP